MDKHLDAYCDHIRTVLRQVSNMLTGGDKANGLEAQRYARYLCDRLAIAYQASLFLKVNPDHADAFLASRIAPFSGIMNSAAGSVIGSTGLNYGSGCVFDKSMAMKVIDDNTPKTF